MIELEHVGTRFERSRGVAALDDVTLTIDLTVAASCPRTIALRDGRVVEDLRR